MSSAYRSVPPLGGPETVLERRMTRGPPGNDAIQSPHQAPNQKTQQQSQDESGRHDRQGSDQLGQDVQNPLLEPAGQLAEIG